MDPFAECLKHYRLHQNNVYENESVQYSRETSARAPCSLSSKNEAEREELIEKAKDLFTRRMPNTVTFTSVEPIRYIRQNRCGWSVKFTKNPGVTWVTCYDVEYRPWNTETMRYFVRREAPHLEIHYALRNCKCVPSDHLDVPGIDFDMHQIFNDRMKLNERNNELRKNELANKDIEKN